MNAQAATKPIIAEVPPHEPKAPAGIIDRYKSLSGFEGREEELGRSVSIILRMLNNHAGYQHEINDPLVKSHLLAMQFAKNNNLVAEYIAHDVKTMEPITLRVRKIVEKIGNKEMALVALFDRTACHYGLALTTTGEGNMRQWKEPFGYVLQQCRKIGQFDLTVQEIHENWTIPRLQGYAQTMAVTLRISPIAEDGTITCEVVD